MARYRRHPDRSQEDDRDQASTKVLADLGQDLVAGGRTEHEVEQDDVRPPLDRGLMFFQSRMRDGEFESRAVREEIELLGVIESLNGGFVVMKLDTRNTQPQPEAPIRRIGLRKLIVCRGSAFPILRTEKFVSLLGGVFSFDSCRTDG